MTDKPDFSKITLPLLPKSVRDLFKKAAMRKEELFKGVIGPRYEIGDLSATFNEWYLYHGKSIVLKVNIPGKNIILQETGEENIAFPLADPDSIQNLRDKLEEIIEQEAEHGRVW